MRTRQRDEAIPETAPEITLRRREHLTFKGNQSRGRHGWLRLTPAYSIHLVQALVAGLSEDEVVLDPFCGTGTTALVCAQHNIGCDTVDVNPFLVWLTTAKCAPYSQADIQRVRAVTDRIASRGLDGSEGWTPPIHDIHKWWSEPTLRALAGLLAQISDEGSPRSQDLLHIAFCRTAIETAAVSFGHQSMSFRRTGSQPTLFDEPASERVLGHFRRAVADVVESAMETPVGTVRAVVGDSRDLPSVLPMGRYTVVITSPPYPNRMSYIRELRPYMYWLGYLSDGRQAGELDWKAI
ncbi:MAG: SAM-dependent methyltransferase, partial [Bacillota bacterium]